MRNVILEFASFETRNDWAKEFPQCARRTFKREPWLAASITDADFSELLKRHDVTVHPDQMGPMDWFPLQAIANDAKHEMAARVISNLMGRKLGSATSNYLDALIVLVNKYEDEHHAICEPRPDTAT